MWLLLEGSLSISDACNSEKLFHCGRCSLKAKREHLPFCVAPRAAQRGKWGSLC